MNRFSLANHLIQIACFNILGEVGAELKECILSALTLAYESLRFMCFDFLSVKSSPQYLKRPAWK